MKQEPILLDLTSFHLTERQWRSSLGEQYIHSEGGVERRSASLTQRRGRDGG